MKVDKLISELKTFNPSADVTLTTSEDIVLSYVCEDGANKTNTPQVFIEGCDTCQKCFHYDDEYCHFYKQNCEDVTECFQYLEE